MKKLYLLIIALAAFFTVEAQWVNDPVNNTFIANTSADAGEIYLSTDPITGNTYMQWSQFASNGWVPKLQRLNFAGEPQWDVNGMEPSHQYAMPSYSQGFAMTATTDNAVVSCFATEAGHSVAVKINADGTYAWGEQGVMLFGGLGDSRCEVIAAADGGVWALGCDVLHIYVQYVNADGTLNNMITISDATGKSCMYGQLTLSNDNRVFVTYEKLGNGAGLYKEKEIYVAGYNPDGSEYSPHTLLMSGKTFQSTYRHYALSDGMGGGYAYIWHAGGTGSSFNVYVFHFDQFGANTLSNTDGTPVHKLDVDNFYISAYATVDPISHDIILVYEQTDAQNQINCKIFMNRITQFGDTVWGDGILVLDNGTVPCGGYRIDAFEYGEGFSVIYHKGISMSSYASTVAAHGFDMNGNEIWNTTMCSSTYNKTGDKNSTGFHGGQNIVAWVKSDSSGLYGQNIGWDGTMGQGFTPPTPPAQCPAPTNFQGEYTYTNDMFGTTLSWDAPETTPLHYNLYCDETKEVIEIEAEYTSCFVEMAQGDYILKLTAVYDGCESDYALTPNGENYILIEVTSVPENGYEEIVNIIAIYNINGQLVNANNVNELNQGMYIVKGITTSGKTVTRKIVR